MLTIGVQNIKRNGSNTCISHIQLNCSLPLLRHNQLNALWCKDAFNKYFSPLKPSGMIFLFLHQNVDDSIPDFVRSLLNFSKLLSTLHDT